MKVLITGIAGFIGFHLAKSLIKHDVEILGVDNVNAYYSTRLKRARLNELGNGVRFIEMDIADHDDFIAFVVSEAPDVIVHLAAQAGVRYSIEKPFDYARANLLGHLAVLEACRHNKNLSHLVYASSSSVYGENSISPFTEADTADQPVSLYAATKRSDELMSSSYSHLYGINQIGLRFFTVYGSWGRPDMAYWKFTSKIFEGAPISVFNNGMMRRDMTHVSDVVAGITATVLTPPRLSANERPHRIYNVGNNQPEQLLDMIDTIEQLVGRRATKVFAGMQPGDVTETYADINSFQTDYNYNPQTKMQDGLREFIEWFRDWRSHNT